MIDFGFGVTLGRLQERDACSLFKWRNDKRVWKWCRQNDLLHWDNHLAWLKRQAADPSLSMYGVYDDSALVGVCGLTSIDPLNRRAEFSLYINPDLHRNGFGGKALKTLFTHGFWNLGLNSIWGETFDGNPAGDLFERLGMKKEGTRRAHYFREGKFIDAHLYSILADEWSY